MSYGRVVADAERRTRIAVQNAAVLHVRAVSDHDGLIVAADNCREPDACFASDHDVSYELSRGREPGVLADQPWCLAVETVSAHDRAPSIAQCAACSLTVGFA